MIVLGSVAVALIVAGVAGPQYLYALDAGRYGDVVQETSELENAFERSEVERDAAEVLLYLQQQEAAALAVRFRALAKADPKVLPKAVGEKLTAAAANITEALDEAEAASKAGSSAIVANELKESDELNPVSWFDVSPLTVGEVADLKLVNAAPLKAESTVTREVLDEARTRHEEAIENKAKSKKALDKRLGQLEQLEAAVAGGLKAVDAAANQAPQLAQALTEVEVDPEGFVPEPDEGVATLATAVRDKALEADATSTATEFVRGADGVISRVVDRSGVDEAQILTLSDESRAVVTLDRVEAFVASATEFLTLQDEAAQLASEQAAAEEAARIAAEEAARLAAEEAARQAAEEAARQEEERRKQQEEEATPPPVEPPPPTEGPEESNDGAEF